MFWFFVISLHIPNLMWGVGVICYATFNLSILLHFPVPLQAATSDIDNSASLSCRECLNAGHVRVFLIIEETTHSQSLMHTYTYIRSF